MHVEPGVMLVCHMTVEKMWETLDVEARNVFFAPTGIVSGKATATA